MSSVTDTATGGDLEVLTSFRQGLYRCLSARRDALFELVDAVLCAQGPVMSLVELSQEKAFRRGHGALYDALAWGAIDPDDLTRLLAGSWTPADAGPVKLAVDVSPWPRPDAQTSPQRCHCYRSCRCDGTRKTLPGWPYSFVAGLEWGATSWTALLNAVRIGPDQDATVVTVGQLGQVLTRLAGCGALTGRPAPVATFDSGYDLTRIAYLCQRAGTGVQVLGRVRCDRVFYGPAGPRAGDRPGRSPRHGARFALADPATHPGPDEHLVAASARYGKVEVSAWHRLHQKLARDGGWQGFTGQLPIVAGTVIRIRVERLPGDRTPEDVWLWYYSDGTAAFDLDLLWRTYLRRFDLEHTFRLLKHVLGWTAPRVRTPEQADRWTGLMLAAHTQLRLARYLAADLRRPWQKPTPPGCLPTPGRVRRNFALLRRKLGTPASRPKPTTAGPGRPAGTTRPPRQRHPVGKKKTTKDSKPGSQATRRG